ncbi:MAG: hypothetical protein P8176_10475 [Gammaproteobacteria bacterium]
MPSLSSASSINTFNSDVLQPQSVPFEKNFAQNIPRVLDQMSRPLEDPSSSNYLKNSNPLQLDDPLEDYLIVGDFADVISRGLGKRAIKILGDGDCAWRATWAALLSGGDRLKLVSALHKYGLEEEIIERVDKAMGVAQQQVGSIFSFGNTRPQQRPLEFQAKLEPSRVKYSDEPTYCEGRTQAEIDLLTIRDRILSQCGIESSRLEDLKKGAHAESHEMQLLAKALNQELVIAGQGQVECLYFDGSPLHEFVQIAKARIENPNDNKLVSSVIARCKHILKKDTLTQFYPMVWHDGQEHFDLFLSDKGDNELHVFQFDFPKKPEEANEIRNRFLDPNVPVWTLYTPILTNCRNACNDLKDLVFKECVESNHDPVRFAEGDTFGESFLLSTWLQILINVEPRELEKCIKTHCGAEADRFLQNLMPAASAAKNNPASVLAVRTVKNREQYNLVAPTLLAAELELDYTNRTPFERILLDLTKHLSQLPQVNIYYKALLAQEESCSSVPPRETSNGKMVEGIYHKCLQDGFGKENGLTSSYEVRLTDWTRDATKALALSSALTHTFNSPICTDFVKFDGLSTDVADGEGNNGLTDALLISAHGHQEEYYNALCAPFDHDPFGLTFRGLNHKSIPLLKEYLKNRVVLQNKCSSNCIWLPTELWKRESLREIKPASMCLSNNKETFKAFHIATDLQRIQRAQRTAKTANELGLNRLEQLRKPALAVCIFAKILKEFASTCVPLEKTPNADQIFEYYKLDPKKLLCGNEVRDLLNLARSLLYEQKKSSPEALAVERYKLHNLLRDLASQKMALIAANDNGLSTVNDADNFTRQAVFHLKLRLHALMDLMVLEHAVDPENWFDRTLDGIAEESWIGIGWLELGNTLTHVFSENTSSSERIEYYLNEQMDFNNNLYPLVDKERAARLGIQEVLRLEDLAPLPEQFVDRALTGNTSSNDCKRKKSSTHIRLKDIGKLPSMLSSISCKQVKDEAIVASALIPFSQRTRASTPSGEVAQSIKRQNRSQIPQNSYNSFDAASSEGEMNPLIEKVQERVVRSEKTENAVTGESSRSSRSDSRQIRSSHTPLRSGLKKLLNKLLPFLSNETKRSTLNLEGLDKRLYDCLEHRFATQYHQRIFEKENLGMMVPTGLPNTYRDIHQKIFLETDNGLFLERSKNEAIVHSLLQLLSNELIDHDDATCQYNDIIQDLQRLL